MSIDLHHNFCHSKIVFVRYCLVVVSEKKCVDENWQIINQWNLHWYTLKLFVSLKLGIATQLLNMLSQFNFIAFIADTLVKMETKFIIFVIGDAYIFCCIN